MSKINYIYQSVDDFGLITSAEAEKLGMSNAELVQQAAKGRLVRVGRGVYRMPVWPYQKEAPYAIAVKSAGEAAFLYGESVIALLELAPTNPSELWIGSPYRVRRELGAGIHFVQTKGITPEYYGGVPCQPVAQAIIDAVATIGKTRAKQAVKEALHQGYITEIELHAIEKEL